MQAPESKAPARVGGCMARKRHCCAQRPKKSAAASGEVAKLAPNGGHPMACAMPSTVVSTVAQSAWPQLAPGLPPPSAPAAKLRSRHAMTTRHTTLGQLECATPAAVGQGWHPQRNCCETPRREPCALAHVRQRLRQRTHAVHIHAVVVQRHAFVFASCLLGMSRFEFIMSASAVGPSAVPFLLLWSRSPLSRRAKRPRRSRSPPSWFSVAVGSPWVVCGGEPSSATRAFSRGWEFSSAARFSPLCVCVGGGGGGGMPALSSSCMTRALVAAGHGDNEDDAYLHHAHKPQAPALGSVLAAPMRGHSLCHT